MKRELIGHVIAYFTIKIHGQSTRGVFTTFDNVGESSSENIDTSSKNDSKNSACKCDDIVRHTEVRSWKKNQEAFRVDSQIKFRLCFPVGSLIQCERGPIKACGAKFCWFFIIMDSDTVLKDEDEMEMMKGNKKRLKTLQRQRQHRDGHQEDVWSIEGRPYRIDKL